VVLNSFSASLPTFALSTTGSTQIAGPWTVTDPYYTGSGFNATTGIYTVPASGKYAVKITINYNTTSTVTVQQASGVNPSFTLDRITPSATTLIAGNMPILNVNVALVLNLRVILGAGEVTLTGDVNLSAGDQIGLFYHADGLTIPINTGGTNQPGIVWSMHSL
jgi:hypothetical protein